jgi:primosomal protein N' (replication factor Y)
MLNPAADGSRLTTGQRYCNVAIAHTRLNELTYRFDPAALPGLGPGDCVRLRLRGKRVSGIVLEVLDRSPGRETLPVDHVAEERLLSPGLLKLLRWVGSYYFGRLGEVLSLALPSGICGYGLRREKAETPVAREAMRAPLPVQLESALAVRRFGVWVSCSETGDTELVAGFAGRLLEAGSVLLLSPELLTQEWADTLAARLGVEPVLVRADLGHAKRKRIWRELHSGERRLVIGVRSAVFAPVHDLAGILVMDEHDKVFKEERRPRYNARDVAIYRARLSGCPVLLCDRTPSVETWHNLATGRYTRLDRPRKPGPGPDTFVVDMRKHRGAVLSPLLLAQVERAQGKGTAVLCLNRKGLSRYVACSDCGSAFRCPDCRVATVLDGKGQLTCRYCGWSETAPELCPVCRGKDFKFRAPGIEMAAREVGRVLPDAQVRIVRSESGGQAGPEPASVLVGTRALLGIVWPEPVALVAALFIDDDLCLPDFRSSERVFHTLAALRYRALSAGARFLVQTRRPDEPAVRAAVEGDVQGFLDEELRLRRELEFPPFRRLALITLEGRLDAVQRHAAGLCRRLGRTPGVEALGPIPVTGNRRAWQLLVKLPRTTRLDRLVGQEQLETRGVKARVDVDPLEVA